MEELPTGFLSLGPAPAPAPTAPPRRRGTPALLDEIVEEILLLVPPEDPTRLVRAALVCKRWASLLADRGFRRRYRERHGGTPPLLGFLANLTHSGGSARFVPTIAFRPAHDARASHLDEYRAHDARHGRVLLNRITWGGLIHHEPDDALAVWDPVTHEHRRLPLLLRPQQVRSWNAAVLCAAAPAACDHLDCRPGGHSLVVFVGVDDKEMFAHVYSSESAAWGEAASAQHSDDGLDEALPGALARNALYFLFRKGNRMLRFDLATRKLLVVSVPHRPYDRRLMAMEDGGLGFAEVDSQFTLKLWSMEVAPDGIEGQWAVSRAIDLRTQLPAPAVRTAPRVVAFADAVGGVIFLKTADGLYTFDLKTGQGVCVMGNNGFYDIIPYVSFFTPVLRVASTDEGPSAGASIARQT